MQWKMSSSLAAIASLFLLAGDLVVAQIDAPICTDKVLSWGWSFNSLVQNPCLIAAYMMSTCYGSVLTLNPLGVGNTHYAGPSREEDLEANPCWCNTVTYNLLSACSGCQGGRSLLWTQYHQNCTRILEPSTFSNPVPVGTRVPHWVLQDTSSSGIWSYSSAQLIGDTPEIFPGELINTPTTSTIRTTTSASLTIVPVPTSPSFTSSGSGLYKGAFAGLVVCGVTAIAAIFLSLFS
ncbi:hypothetical protein EDB92DRAFT_711304 [Lactarius akahatsu]|uniref:Uncharacterized protein n=1 Tax=Lactarius akahatsu TaxID=416441 RepID=A0AAD4L2R4_9AGAM|nr:hypothetical protein EDB92DRAFT_711304 [Lactarius akahatsu]